MLSCFSSYEGWDNPFRPEGEISHDAEELLRLWRLGKLDEQNKNNLQSDNNNEDNSTCKGTPKHPNGKISNNNSESCSGSPFQQNGAHSSTFEVKRETVGSKQQSQQLQQVTINDGKVDNQDPQKKKTGGCCSIM